MATKHTTFGGITQLPSGRFRARYRVDGRQVTLGVFDHHDEARSALDAVRVDIRRGDHFDKTPGRVPFERFMRDTYMPFRKTEVATSTYVNDESLLRRHLLPAFGRKALVDISAADVHRWWASLPETQVRRNGYFLLTRALDHAVLWSIIRSSPAMVQKAGREVARPRPTWTVDDFRAVLLNVPEDHQGPLRVLFGSHARLGELIGLNRSDYDRATQTLLIERQITGQSLTPSPTKTKQTRTIVPLKIATDVLDQLPRAIGAVPMFAGARTERLPRNSLRKVWMTACAAAGLDDFHLHDLRHVSLSLVAEAGAPIRDIMTRGGHASMQSALRYQHSTRERDAAVAARVNALL